MLGSVGGLLTPAEDSSAMGGDIGTPMREDALNGLPAGVWPGVTSCTAQSKLFWTPSGRCYIHYTRFEYFWRAHKSHSVRMYRDTPESRSAQRGLP